MASSSSTPSVLPHERPSPYGAPPAPAGPSGAPATHHPAYVGVGGFALPKLPDDFVYGVSLPVNLAVPERTPTVKGYDFSQGADPQRVLDMCLTTGFQATHFGLAVN